MPRRPRPPLRAKPADHAARAARARLSLEGLALGDAFGERFFVHPDEALARIERRDTPGGGTWRWTDDTAMAISIVEALERDGFIEQEWLAAAFASRYETEPERGYGGGAHQILSRIAGGERWDDAAGEAFGGVGSFGNGGAMRAAPIGAYFAGEPERAAEEASLSAAITHAHPEGKAGAVAVAAYAAAAARAGADPRDALRIAAQLTPPGHTRRGIEDALATSLDASPRNVGARLGNGSAVSAPDTVPFTLWCAAAFPDSLEEALWATVSALGDRDTTCAIVGGIVALTAGLATAPAAWLAAREALPPPRP